MSEHKYKHYLAFGEQTDLDTAEKTTVGFMPVKSFVGIGAEFEDTEVVEFRGDESVLGVTNVIRYGQKWNLSPEMPFFVESGGGEKNIPAMLFKHLAGHGVNAQNASTGQFNNTVSPVSNPRATGNLGTKALTLNSNLSHGDTVRNHPHVGGLVKSIKLTQAFQDELKITVEHPGAFVEANEAEVGSPTYPAENLRLKYNHLKAYSGGITPVGAAPDYTDFTLVSGNQFKPQSLDITLSCERDLVGEMCGKDYPTNITDGEHMVTIEFAIDYKNPASGFNSLDEFTAWLAGVDDTAEFCFHWDTGVVAGTGDNYSQFLYLPEMYRQKPDIDWDPKKTPIITLKYKGKYNATSKALWIALTKNTATAI